MNVLKLALRNSFRKNGSNIVKILSLWIGLTISLVLIAKIVFELSFDNYYPDNERVYQVWSNFSMATYDMEPFEQTAGAVAWGMKNEIPEVENATRFTWISSNLIYTENKDFLLAESVLADENLFDILYRPIITGDAKEILKLPMHCLVSKTLAKKLGMEDIIGKTITLEHFPEKQLVIGGVFEDFPENSTVKIDVIISLISISNFTWDGTENWEGNERYSSFVKLRQGVDPKSLTAQVTAMKERHIDMEELEKAGVTIDWFFVNISDVHKNAPVVKQLILIFGLLSAVLLITSILNYILTTISSLVNRTKEIAVHKCYGASKINIYELLFSETLIHIIVALILSAFTILMFESAIIDLLQTSLRALFAPQILVFLTGVCVVILFITGFLPAYLFSKIPVTAAFQRAKESHRRWKIVLIFFEVMASALIISLLMMVALQYHKFINADQGYSYKDLLYVEKPIIRNPETRNQIIQELKMIPEVARVSLCSLLPVYGASGNNISELGKEKELFNIADLYWVDENFLSVMEIPIIEGKGFIDGETGNDVMMVSESFAEKMAELAGWTDGVVGKSLMVSEHGKQTICGVFGNIVISPGSFGSDERPAVIFYGTDKERFYPFLIKMHTITPEIIKDISDVFQKFVPDKYVDIKNYEEHFKSNFSTLKILRSGMLFCSIITLFIALIGIMGYFHDETNRRRSEIAIRKINGATVNNIQGLFLKNVLKIAIPAITVGSIVSIFVSKLIQKNYIDNTHISLFLYILCGVCITSIILAVVSLNIYKAGARNPVENLAKE
jgi:putative ABC transport system permease protein